MTFNTITYYVESYLPEDDYIITMLKPTRFSKSGEFSVSTYPYCRYIDIPIKIPENKRKAYAQAHILITNC